MARSAGRFGAAVVVPVYNRLELLRRTVSSLQAQTMRDSQFILVDDRSDDSVWNFMQSLPSIDSRFTVIRKPDDVPRGCQASRNIGLDACDADSVVFLDSDDLLSSDCLEHRNAVLRSRPQLDVVVGRQVMFSDRDATSHWVNLPHPGVSDLDRFLAIGDPVDVPWVNGGVSIRVPALRASRIRWRPDFHWDDVAFHFECLVAGLEVGRMTFPGPADAFYRQHHGENYGQVLFTPDGIRSAAKMLQWMHDELDRAGSLSDSRKRALAFSFFQTCVLRALDLGEYSLAGEVTTAAAEGGLVSASDSARFQAYRAGRMSLRRWRRLTYYWNRVMRPTLLADYYSQRPSTYGTTALQA